MWNGAIGMTSFNVKTRVKADGTLQVVVPTGLPESDVDVLLVVRPSGPAGAKAAACRLWPDGFFDQTFGCLEDDLLVRPPQFQLDAREKLL